MTRTLLRTVGALFALAVVAAACGNDDGGGTAAPTTEATTTTGGAGGDACAAVDLSNPPSEPVTIRLGHGTAAEEQVWLQYVDPEAAGATHYGTWYTIEGQPFTPTDRLDAYQAGELDAGTISTPQLIRAVGAGLDIGAVVSVAVESDDPAFFNTTYSALETSGLTGPADLAGAKIGILAPNTSTEYWAKSAVRSGGLDPDRDVEYVAIPFPEQEQALRDGTIDVAVFVEPFYTIAHGNGGLVDVFDSITGPGFEQELLSVFFDRSFVAEHPEAVCAWRADFAAATEAYLADRGAAAAILIDAGLLRAPNVEAVLATGDWKRRPDGALNVENLGRIQDDMVDSGFLGPDEKVPAGDLIIDGYAVTG